MITAVSFGIERIPNKDTFDGTIEDFRVVMTLDEDEGTTADLAKVGEVGRGVKPTFVWSKTVL